MKSYAVVVYDYQDEISKSNPRTIKLYKKADKAIKFAFDYQVKKWTMILKKGVRNDSFQYYKQRIIDKGINLNSINKNNVIQLVKLIKTGTVKDDNVGEISLKNELDLVQVNEIEDVSKKKSKDRFILIENELYHTGENYKNRENKELGLPIISSDDLSNIKKTQNIYELKTFYEKVLGKNPLYSIRDSQYWSEPVFVDDSKIQAIESSLNDEGIDPINMDNTAQIEVFKKITEEKVGFTFVNFYGIVKIRIK
jgi:hypothetical protein